MFDLYSVLRLFGPSGFHKFFGDSPEVEATELRKSISMSCSVQTYTL